MSVIGPRPGLWNQDILTAERDKYNANDVKPGLELLFVKRIKRKSVKRIIHQALPPACE